MGFLSRTAINRELDEEWKALTTLRLVLDAAELAAVDLMRRYPDHAGLSPAVVDFASDGKSDIVGAIAALDERVPRYPDRGGAT
jgi:hypothetical protein